MIKMRIFCNPDLENMVELIDDPSYDKTELNEFKSLMPSLNRLYHKKLPAYEMEFALAELIDAYGFEIDKTEVENSNTDGTGSVIITFSRLF